MRHSLNHTVVGLLLALLVVDAACPWTKADADASTKDAFLDELRDAMRDLVTPSSIVAHKLPGDKDLVSEGIVAVYTVAEWPRKEQQFPWGAVEIPNCQVFVAISEEAASKWEKRVMTINYPEKDRFGESRTKTVDLNGLSVQLTVRHPKWGENDIWSVTSTGGVVWRRGNLVAWVEGGYHFDAVKSGEEDPAKGLVVTLEEKRRRVEPIIHGCMMSLEPFAHRVDAVLRPHRLLVHLVEDAPGVPSFPLRLRAELQEKKPGSNDYTPYKDQVPFYVECSDPDSGESLLACIRADPSLKDPLGANRALERYTQILFDSTYQMIAYRTDVDGKAEISLAWFGSQESVAKTSGVGPGSKYLTARQGTHKLNFDLLGATLYRTSRQRKSLSMKVQVFAAPSLGGIQPGNKKRDVSDFNVASQPVVVSIDRIADIIASETMMAVPARQTVTGKPVVAMVQHAWDPPADAKTWSPVGKVPFPVQPNDKISLGSADQVSVRWANGGTCLFAMNPKALKDPTGRVEFWVSPTQTTDRADRANYPDNFWSYIEALKSPDPTVAVPVKGGQEAASFVLSKVPEAVGKVVGVVVSVVSWGLERVQPPPSVIMTRLESRAVYVLGPKPSIFLLEGKLTLLDSKGKALQALAPGQMFRFDEKWQPSNAVAFVDTDLPAGTKEVMASLPAVGAEMPLAASSGEQTEAPTSSGLIVALAVAGTVVLAAVVLIVVRYFRRVRS